MIRTDFCAPFALLRISFLPGFAHRLVFAAILLVATSIGLRSAASPTITLQTVALSGQPIPGVGGTFPSDYHPTTFMEPTINNSGQVLFRGGLPAGFSGAGVFTGTPGNLRLVARPNTPVPGDETGLRFNSILDEPLGMNEQGTVVFLASIQSAAGFDRGKAIWRQDPGGPLIKVVGTGDPVPNISPAAQFTNLGAAQLNNAGALVFNASANSPNFLNGGHWAATSSLGLQLVADTGIAAPGISGGSITSYHVGLTSDEIYVHATVNVPTTPFSSSRYAATWRGNSYETLQPVFYGKNPAPNIPGFLDFTFSPSDSVFAEANDAGQIAAIGQLRAFNPQNNLISQNGLYVIQPDGSIRTVALQGSQIPGGPPGTVFGDNYFDFEINDSGRVAFLTGVSQSGGGRAIFSEGPDGILKLVALQQSHAPGTPTGVHFGADLFPSVVGSVFNPPAYNNRGQVAFLAEVQGPGVTTENEIGLWGTDRRGVLTLLAREGNPLEVTPGVFRTVAELLFVGGNGDAQNRYTGLNDASQVLFAARFIDGTSGLFITDALAVPEPTCAALLSLALTALLSIVRNRA